MLMKPIIPQFPKWLRILLPVVTILVWLGISGFGGKTFSKLNNVIDNNQVAFLPTSAASTKVAKIEQKFYKTNTIPAIIVVTSSKRINQQQLRALEQLDNSIKNISGVSKSVHAILGPITSKDGRAVEYIVTVESSSNTPTTIKELRNMLSKHAPESMKYYVTGPAGLSADLVDAFSGIDGILLVVALISVFVILLLVYRSIILPVIVLLTAMFALTGAILLIYQLALHGIIKLNGESQGILSILVIGAATDYSLLLVARYRESLHHIESKWSAMISSLRAVIEPIGASALTVILALLCLLFSDLYSNKSLGPVAAFGIAFSFLAALSFLPAILIIFGRKAFWPFEPRYAAQISSKPTLWSKIAGFVAKKPATIWRVTSAALIILAFGLAQLNASGVPNTQTILGHSNAVAGQAVLKQHFPAGSGSPIVIVALTKDYKKVMQVVAQNKYVVNPTILTYQGQRPLGSINSNEISIKNNQVLLNATLTTEPESKTAQQTITRLRDSLAQDNLYALIGGTSAIQLDSNTTAKNDLHRIIPLVLVVILVILIVLLRSLLAPVILILSVILSYAATLGTSAFVFNHIMHFPGADPSVPLFGFIFLVALGIDYNIFLMTRVREESLRSGTKQGIVKGLSITGNVITSAGVVLAATFAALSVIPILFLAQIAFIVSFGVLLDTILVRSLLVPAISYDLGKVIWWPSKLWSAGKK